MGSTQGLDNDISSLTPRGAPDQQLNRMYTTSLPYMLQMTDELVSNGQFSRGGNGTHWPYGGDTIQVRDCMHRCVLDPHTRWGACCVYGGAQAAGTPTAFACRIEYSKLCRVYAHALIFFCVASHPGGWWYLPCVSVNVGLCSTARTVAAAAAAAAAVQKMGHSMAIAVPCSYQLSFRHQRVPPSQQPPLSIPASVPAFTPNLEVEHRRKRRIDCVRLLVRPSTTLIDFSDAYAAPSQALITLATYPCCILAQFIVHHTGCTHTRSLWCVASHHG